MSDIPRSGRNSVSQQASLFRRAEHEYGLTLAKLATATDISLSTLKGWRNGAAMPAWGLFALGEAGVPDDLLTLVSAPFAKSVITDEPGEGDFDTAAIDAGELSSAVAKARHPASPGGTRIVPQEAAIIQIKAGRSSASARRVAV